MNTESKCPFHNAHAGNTEEIPKRIAKLPVHRGFHVPWFVAKIDGEYDFRIADSVKFKRAVRDKLCWVCGEKLGKFKSFVIGPMCGITRTSAEPPVHRECGIYSATACPFLSRPNMKRREDEVTLANEGNGAGVAIKRNSGACGVWTVEDFVIFRDHNGRILHEVGDPVSVEWFAEGRAATREEVVASIDSGIHHLREACDSEANLMEITAAHTELTAARERFEQYLPQP